MKWKQFREKTENVEDRTMPGSWQMDPDQDVTKDEVAIHADENVPQRVPSLPATPLQKDTQRRNEYVAQTKHSLERFRNSPGYNLLMPASESRDNRYLGVMQEYRDQPQQRDPNALPDRSMLETKTKAKKVKDKGYRRLL